MDTVFRLSRLPATDIKALLLVDLASLPEEQARARQRFVARAGGMEKAKEMVDLLVEVEREESSVACETGSDSASR
jgi:hypothetical protein